MYTINKLVGTLYIIINKSISKYIYRQIGTKTITLKMDDGYDRFADNDVFNMDLDQIKSVGHSLVAIQSRVNETVSKFNESMGDSDGLGDLRIRNASNNRNKITKLLSDQERRARPP